MAIWKPSRRLFLAGAGLIAAPAIVRAQSPQIRRLLLNQMPVAAGGGLDPATTAWVNAVVGAGGAVSATQQTRVDTLIVALKGHGLFAKLDRLWLWAGESDGHQSTIDIINLAVGTVHATLTLGASGYTGDGTSGYFDSGFNLATGGGQYTTAAAMFGVYEMDARASGGNKVVAGAQDSSGHASWAWTYNFNATTFFINVGPNLTPAATTANGLWVLTLLSGTSSVYNWSTTNVHSGFLTSGANASPVSPGATMAFLALNGNGTPSDFDPGTFGAAFIGGSFSSTDTANFASDLNAYMTAWGVNKF